MLNIDNKMTKFGSCFRN